MIQVDQSGQNNIIICGGANDSVSKEMIDEAVKMVEEGDIVLLQNEISNVGYAAETAKKSGAKIALNPSPINENLKTIPMDLVDYFILNEIEGKEISQGGERGTGRDHGEVKSEISERCVRPDIGRERILVF